MTKDFNPLSDPIATVEHIYLVNEVAIRSTGVFDRDYFQLNGERIIGSPIPVDNDSGYVILEDQFGYRSLYYQRTHHTNGVGLHNYLEFNPVFSHPQSARRHVRNTYI